MLRAHLLIVDDEPTILTTLQRMLTMEGYNVDVAGGARVTEKKLEKRQYALCVFDFALPRRQGISLLQFARPAKNDVPVIMMCGPGTSDAAVDATRHGALSFVEKPLNTDALLMATPTPIRLDRALADAPPFRAAAPTGRL